MRWAKGTDVIDRLLTTGGLERLIPSEQVVAQLLTDADRHIALATLGVSDQAVEPDLVGALQLAYDAARKACAALLEQQGLRATSRGGHIAIADAVEAQFNGPNGIKDFSRLDRLRRRRNASEYPTTGSGAVDEDEVAHAIGLAQSLLEHTHRLIATDRLGVYEAI
jgi:hypothetical protein